jgi:4-hydroxy-2-oxoheptanedioate aldolase
MARTAFDWLTLDLEHTPTSLETAASCFGLIAGAGKVPLARLGFNNIENIKRVLDCGAYGIVVPMVNSRAEAEAVVSAARYHPLGERSIGGQLHSANFETDGPTYYAKANDEILVIVMIEHARGVERAEEILKVPGIDGCFIGPNDLHHSYGQAPAFESDSKEFVQAVDHVFAACKKYQVPCGIHVADAAMAQRRREQGFQFIAVASEIGMMLQKANEITKSLGLTTGGAAIKY